MAYSDYTLSKIEEKFGILSYRKKLFDHNTQPISEISDWLKYSLSLVEELPIKSEKAKSELIVMPILIELRNKNAKYFTIYSGEMLNIDEELKGECDFILSKDTGSFEINAPIMQLVEAKRNDVESGIAQCAAQMIGAQKYNEERKYSSNEIYGCVTTGDDWLFMRLNNKLEIDTKKYYLGSLSELLGVFQNILDTFRNNENEIIL
jgi:hypothetical protein